MITWKMGDLEDTRRVSQETGIPFEKLNEMFENAKRATWIKYIGDDYDVQELSSQKRPKG